MCRKQMLMATMFLSLVLAASCNFVTDLFIKAQLAEQIEDYAEMRKLMRDLVLAKAEQGFGLDEEERAMLSVAYKNEVGDRRSAWQLLDSKPIGDDRRSEITLSVKAQVVSELIELSDELVDLVKNYLIPSVDPYSAEVEQVEFSVFYHKMMADYLRYQAEVTDGDESIELTDASMRIYQVAYELANNLKSTNPVRLALALNLSSFYYNFKMQPEKAIEVAQGAFDDAIRFLDTLDENDYKDVTQILHMIRENLKSWLHDSTDDNY